jgi:hypothetical protein
MPHLKNFSGNGDPYYNSTKIIDVLRLFDSFNEENKNNFEDLDEDNHQYTEFGEVDENENIQYSWDSLIKTGILIRLKDQNGNTLDETKILMFGDSSIESSENTTYDGIVDLNDFANALSIYKASLQDETRNQEFMTGINYRSSLYYQYLKFINAINEDNTLSTYEFVDFESQSSTTLFTYVMNYYKDAVASNKVYKYALMN